MEVIEDVKQGQNNCIDAVNIHVEVHVKSHR